MADMDNGPQTTTSGAGDQLPVGEGQNGTAQVPAPQPPPQTVQAPPPQQAPADPLAGHPAVQQASVIRRVGETIAGGPRVKTTIDPNTGEITREKQPLQTKDILLGALANILGSVGQVSGNLSDRMQGRRPEPIQPLPTQQAQAQQVQQSEEDFNRVQNQKVRQAKVLNANLEAMRTAYALGKENDDAKDSVISNHADDLANWSKAGAVEATQVPSNELMKKGFDKTKYVAVPDGRVPVFNPDGTRATDSNGVPLSQLTYSVVDGTTQAPLSQDKYNQLAKYGLMTAKEGFKLPEGASISSAQLALMNHKLDLIQQTQRELDEVTGDNKVDLAAQIKNNPQILSAIEKFHNDGASTEPYNQINNLQAKNPAAAGLMRELFGNDNLNRYKDEQLAKTKKEAIKQEAEARESTPTGQQELANKKLTGEELQLKVEQLKKTVAAANWGDNGLSGGAYLTSLPPDQQSLIKELGTGKIGMDRLGYLVARKPEVLEAVARAYPDFDSTKVKNYIDTSKDFTNGKTSHELVAGGTALKHLSELQQLNTIESRIPGTKDYQRFQNKLDTIAPELGRFYGNETISGIADYKKTLGSLVNRDAAIETQARSMGDRLDSYEQKWKNAAPSASYQAPLPNIDAAALQARSRLDPEYAKRTQGQQQPQNKPQNFAATSSDGKWGWNGTQWVATGK